MKKILIVEDEFLIRLGLKTTIHWEEYGYSIVGEAVNGQEALGMMTEYNPDIVLTDIQMPVMDGIEFMTKAKQKNERTKFIILTNHDNFSYAKQAIKLGVSRYILKSEINEDSLLSALASIDREIAVSDITLSKQPSQVEYLRKVLERTPINKCIPYLKLSVPDKQIFSNPYYIVVKYSCNISAVQEKTLDFLSKILIELISNTYSGIILHSMTHKAYHYVVGIVAIEGTETNLDKMFLERSNIIKKKFKQYFSLSLCGGCSSIRGPREITRLLYESERAREEYFFQHTNFAVYSEEWDENATKYQSVPINNSKIMKYISMSKLDELNNYIHNLFQQLYLARSFCCVEQMFIELISIAKAVAEKYQREQSKELATKWDFAIWEELSNIETMEDYIKEVFQLAISPANKEVNGYSSSVRRCLLYIEEHYNDVITLEEVAKDVDISKSYLSMLFKQETGINFVAYLNQYRLEKAKELLVTTNMKIYEIASTVGFDSPYYFSKLFKETTGLQCKEYRDLNYGIEQ